MAVTELEYTVEPFGGRVVLAMTELDDASKVYSLGADNPSTIIRGHCARTNGVTFTLDVYVSNDNVNWAILAQPTSGTSTYSIIPGAAVRFVKTVLSAVSGATTLWFTCTWVK